MNKNLGYGTSKSMGDALKGKSPTTHFSPKFIEEFCYAPLTSAEVERTFSALNNILTVWRLDFDDKHLKWHLVLVANWEDE